MRRSVWTAVMLTTLSLVPWGLPLRSWLTASGLETLLHELLAGRFPGPLLSRVNGTAALASALLFGAVMCAALAVRAFLATNERRRSVLSQARQGRATAVIARRTGLAQDAVRLLLQPEGRS
jgi:hypothetical protein